MLNKTVSYCGFNKIECIGNTSKVQKVAANFTPQCNIPDVTKIMAPESLMGELFKPQRHMLSSEIDECLNALSNLDYTSIPEETDAIIDTPVAEVFLHLWRSFPNAKVILTQRNASEWAKKRIAEAEHNNPAFAPIQNPCGHLMHYPNLRFDENELEKLFHLHSDLVQCLVPEDQLFIVNAFVSKPNVEEEKQKPNVAQIVQEMPEKPSSKDTAEEDANQKHSMWRLAEFLNVTKSGKPHLDESFFMQFPHCGLTNPSLI